MCLHPRPVSPVPEETARVARAAFPKGNTLMEMRDELGKAGDLCVQVELLEDLAHVLRETGDVLA